MLIFGYRLTATRRKERSRKAEESTSPGGAFALGFFLIATGMPGALPYFAAIDQMLRADLPQASTIMVGVTLAMAAMLGSRLLED